MKFLSVVFLVSALLQPDLAWNRFETKNFEVLSVSKEDGRKLSDSLERMRAWSLERWGIKSDDFAVKAKVVLAPDREAFVKLFGKDAPGVRVDRDGLRVKAASVWVWAEPRWETGALQQYLTEVCVADFEARHRVTIPLWARVGMAGLNSNVASIRGDLAPLHEVFSKNEPCFWTEDLLAMTPEKLKRYKATDQALFRREAVALCLYLQKERGKFVPFLEAAMQSPDKALRVLDLTEDRQLDAALHAYMANLSKDLVDNKVPNSYLTWR